MFRNMAPALAALTLTGCIVLPVAPPEESPYSEEVVEALVPGTTTREAVRAGFGDPSGTYLEERYWAYRADRRMAAWLVAFVIPAGFGGYGDIDIMRDVREYVLILEFDRKGTLQAFDVVDEATPCREDRSLCFGEQYLEVPFSDPGKGRADACSVFLALTTLAVDSDRRKIFVSESVRHQRRLLRDPTNESFVLLELPPGKQIVHAVTSVDEEETVSFDFECTAGDLLGIEIDVRPDRERRVDVVTGAALDSLLAGRRWRIAEDRNVESRSGRNRGNDGYTVGGAADEIIERSDTTVFIYSDGKTIEVVSASDADDAEPTLLFVEDASEREALLGRYRANSTEVRQFDSGRPDYAVCYRNGVRHGLYTAWQPDGTVAFETCYDNGETTSADPDQCRPNHGVEPYR